METQEVKELRAAFSDPANVIESAQLYDTIIVCPSMFGAEGQVRGWFNTFNAFATARDHRFFKVRTEGTANLAYTNMESADSMNFPFEAYSMGISFFSPASNFMAGIQLVPEQGGPPSVMPGRIDPSAGHLWKFELPRHAAIVLKTNQDVRVEVPCYAAPPGYGPTGGGAALEQNTMPGPNGVYSFKNYKQHSTLNTFGTQGVPIITNRFKFPNPLIIPKNSTIEGELVLSEYARTLIGSLMGPQNYVFANGNVAVGTNMATFFPMRFGIRLSLFGKRMIQQRGQYHV